MLTKYFLQGFIFLLSISLLSACQMPPNTKTPESSKVTQPTMKMKTRATSYVYLDPIPKEERTAYIYIKNDSGSDVFNVRPWLVQSLQEKSFTIVNNIDQANLVVRANLFRFGKIETPDANITLVSEFGNSAQILSIDGTGRNDAVILDMQYFSREDLIDPETVEPRSSMANLNDIQLLLLCNSNHWERYQARIVSVIFDSQATESEKLKALGQSIATANEDIIRGLST